MGIFEQYSQASWQVGSKPTYYFPVKDIKESGGNRIIKRERPYRDGAKCDDTGSNPKTWSMNCLFISTTFGEYKNPSNLPLYPDILNALIESCDVHEVGNLVVPTRGRIRARFESYSRIESCEDRDFATCDLTFIEDNEDNVGSSSFEPLSIQGNAKQIIQTTFFDATKGGIWDENVSDFLAFADELEAIANYPGDTIANIDSQVGGLIEAVNQVGRAFTRESEQNRNLLNDPEMSLTQRKLEETKDVAARARAEAYKGRPRLVPYFIMGDTNIFTVAAKLNRPAEELIEINRTVDPFYLPNGLVINIIEEP